MYMEAYGGATSVAENIIKKVAHTAIANKIADEKLDKAAISKDGVSPENSEGVGSQANPNIVRDMERISSQKAMESLNSKIENLKARNWYLEDLANNKQKEIDSMNQQIGEINTMVKGLIK